MLIDDIISKIYLLLKYWYNVNFIHLSFFWKVLMSSQRGCCTKMQILSTYFCKYLLVFSMHFSQKSWHYIRYNNKRLTFTIVEVLFLKHLRYVTWAMCVGEPSYQKTWPLQLTPSWEEGHLHLRYFILSSAYTAIQVRSGPSY